jgi:hypothetical protein
MQRDKIRRAVKNVLYMRDRGNFTNEEARRLLNGLEKSYPQDVFIKTNLCEGCNKLHVEVWVKEDSY